MQFEPKIMSFCCQFCAYSAADLAGSLRLQYPPNVRIVRLLCSGKVDALYLLNAFKEGWDGVFVAGCLEGECHFLTGNLHAKQWVNYTKKLLKDIGIEPERLEMFNMSAAMGTKFADTVREMTERIKKLGPSPLNKTKVAAGLAPADKKR